MNILNPWVIAGVLASVLVAGIVGYDVGVTYTEAKQQEAKEKQLKSDARALEKLRETEAKSEVIYRDRIKIVRETVDNCLDQRIAEPVLNQLRDAKLGP